MPHAVSVLCAIEGRWRGLYAVARVPRASECRDVRDLFGTGTGGSKRAVSGSRCPARATGAGDSRACSGRAAFVSTMEPADFRDRYDDGAVASRHDRPRNRRVFVQRQVRAGLVVVRTIERHQSNQTLCLPESQSVDLSARLERELNADAVIVFGVLSLLGSGTRGERARDGRDVHLRSSTGGKRAAESYLDRSRSCWRDASRPSDGCFRPRGVRSDDGGHRPQGSPRRRHRRQQSRSDEKLARLCPATDACGTVRNRHDRASSAAAGPLR